VQREVPVAGRVDEMSAPEKDVKLATKSATRLVPSFRRISSEEEERLSTASSLPSAWMAQYGYHNGHEFSLPKHLVRYIEPTEGEFDQQVEYDMDEQDKYWLDELNAERKRDQLDVISYETFEIIFDRLEKEWFSLVKRIPSRFSFGEAMDEEEFPEESQCAICDDNECENLNAIVFCDGCNLAVHQECYGVPFIPEGQWLCRKCTVSPDRPVSCIFCPQEGGAFKQTSDGKWAHLLCAMWIPETGVSNSVYMEPIDGVQDIPKARWRLRCYLCNSRHGACIQCEHRSCFTAFHVMCARRVGLLGRTQDISDEARDTKPDAAAAYCHRHLPLHRKAALYTRIRGTDDDDNDTSSVSDVSTSELATVPKRPATSGYDSIVSKSARAYNKLYSSGPLPVPNYMVRRVLDYISRISIRRKSQAVALIVRYWSLKRQQMRGAPLLKRLHIEPWTVGHFVDERTHALKLTKLQYLFFLREDLEKVRLLAELVRKREKTKLKQLQLFRTYMLDQGLLYKQAQLHQALECVMALDKAQWFMYPVSKEAPGYYDIIKEPMDWNTIRSRIDTMSYRTWEAWEADVRLVCTNATTYNQPQSLISKTAQKILKSLPDIVKDTRDTSVWEDGTASGLEPPDALLQMLQAPYMVPDGISIGAPPQDATVMDAFLEQWYTVPNPEEPRAMRPPPKKPKRTAKLGPVRRSARHAPEPSEPTIITEPCVVDEINAKDSFKYFNVGWLLPPGARRGNRPRPEPRAQIKRPKVARRTRRHGDGSSSLSELSDA